MSRSYSNSIRSAHAPPPVGRKRIIVCCDGTWMNSLGKKAGKPPSNVTRISRVLKRTCLDGTHQVILYHPGVGSSGSKLDQFTGGTFGMGLDRDIREVYNFVCNNYDEGDDIILIGFSRGAFTARSVADMIASVGILNASGLDHFYDIFRDYEHMGDEKRDTSQFLFQDLTPFGGETGKARLRLEERRKREFQRWLRDTMHWTRDSATIKALGVWDTVGTLGIPPAPVVGIRGSARQFTNTQISDLVENAFQALALDEPRFAFRPALWESVGKNRTNLKQVWFPGNHGGVGGGWYDQQIADITLAWMCDQLSTIGVEFNYSRMRETFVNNLRYSAAHPYPFVPQSLLKRGSDPKPWARPPICKGVRRGQKPDVENCTSPNRHPPGPPKGRLEHLWDVARSWGLGQTRYPDSWVQTFAGTTVRHPGLFMRADTLTNQDTDRPLVNTNERIHSSVRVRLACDGLGMDDRDIWDCEALTKAKDGGPLWKLENRSGLDKAEAFELRDYRPFELRCSESEYPGEDLYEPMEGDGEWRWVFRGGDEYRPYYIALPEEPLVGYWERLLLGLTAGRVDVWRWAEENPPNWVMAKARKRRARSAG